MGDQTEVIERLAGLLREVGEAHARAFAATQGYDPEWPQWYAEHLMEPLGGLGIDLRQDELAGLLVEMDEEHRRQDPEADWPTWYARHLAERGVV